MREIVPFFRFIFNVAGFKNILSFLAVACVIPSKRSASRNLRIFNGALQFFGAKILRHATLWLAQDDSAKKRPLDEGTLGVIEALA